MLPHKVIISEQNCKSNYASTFPITLWNIRY